MRKAWVRGWEVVLLAGVGVNVAGAWAADPPPSAPAKNSAGGIWWNPWGSPGEKKTAATADREPSPEVKGLLKSDDPSSKRVREQQTLFRRLDVCDQLKAIAARKCDETLMRQAEDLEARAWDVYTRRVTALPAGRAAAGDGDLDLGLGRGSGSPIEVSRGK
jgi:hypothetical protein